MHRNHALKASLKPKVTLYANRFHGVYGGIALRQLADGNLTFFDGNPKTNQCHINALYTVLLYQKYQQEYSLTQDDIKFLILSFFTLIGLRNQNARKTFINTHLPNNLAQPESELYSNLFTNNVLKDHCAPHQLGLMLFKNVGTILGQDLTPDHYRFKHDDETPTYPKFLGAQIFLEQAHRQGINFVVKNCIVTPCGKHVYIKVFKGGAPEYIVTPNSPVIVIDGHSFSDGTPLGEPAFYCQTPAPLCPACADVIARFNNYPLDQLVLPCAADFTAKKQPSYEERFLSDNQDYATNLVIAQAEGMSEDNPRTFVIDHVHADRFDHTLFDDQLMHATTTYLAAT